MLVPASLIVGALGASIGSFINVVVYRLPAGLSVISPPSRCPACLNKLKAYDNVPVLGWLWLKGRCRYCKSKISMRYPVVESVTGLLFLLVFWVFQYSPQTIGYWIFCSWLLALSLIDFDTMTLPNPLTKSGLVLGVLFHTVLAFVQSTNWNSFNQIFGAILGAVVGIWLFDAISFIGWVIFQKEAMGGGDAKLAAMMGAWLGWRHLLLAILISCVVGVVAGSIGVVLSRRKWGKKMPFGPCLALGSLITLLVGEMIISSYLRLFP
ncbi:type 4 prepilin peptidase 1 [Calothrix sp. NIES-4071]|nr:type 4 prepilin peptidase 1 [Calothrix sp. NIES-4071]BAZ57085.1 type 4 prepilin peptidase 1 [Calothrix sp. NIES-4105]